MTAKTLSVIFKEKFSKMSDDMNDIKEVNNFYKEAIKDAIEEKKSVGKKKKPSPEKNENGEEKIKKPPTEYQEFVKNYQQVIKEKFPDLPSNQRFGKIAEEWKIFKENRDNNESQVKNKSVAVVNNFMKVEEVSPPSSDNEDEPKEEPKEQPKEQPKEKPKEQPKEKPKLPNEEPDDEAVEEPDMSSKKKKNTLVKKK
jgi:translation initiation factor 4G